MDEERRTPPFAEDTLALLTEAAGGTGEELPRDEALDVIAPDERFDKTEAEEALTQLESRGHIYFVGENVRITPTDACAATLCTTASRSSLVTDGISLSVRLGSLYNRPMG